MAAWRYVGYKNGWQNYRYWTNQEDTAYASGLNDDEIEDYPHPSASINEGEIVNDYNGDVMAWMEDNGVIRESLGDIR